MRKHHFGKSFVLVGATTFFLMLLSQAVFAAGGGNVADLIVVADTRVINNSILKYFADLYNTDMFMSAVWGVGLTAAYGVFLGLVMDFFIKRTGIDLKSRKIVEH